MAVNRGLGKGLSALFSDTDAEYMHSEMNSISDDNDKSQVTENKKSSGKPLNIAIEKIYANPSQPRKVFDAAALNELADSIKEHGIIQPIVLTYAENGKYMIIAGERRFRAAKLAGLMEVPAFIGEFTPKEIKEVSLIENLQREDLNAIEAATAIKQLMDEHSLTQEEVSKRIGKSRSAIANLLRLLSLPTEVITYVNQGKLSEGQARALIGLDYNNSVTLANQAIQQNLTVREMEQLSKGGKSKKKSGIKPQIYTPIGQSRELKDLISTMQRVLGTKITAVGSDTKGRIYIDYFSTDDLDRIFYVMEKLK